MVGDWPNGDVALWCRRRSQSKFSHHYELDYDQLTSHRDKQDIWAKRPPLKPVVIDPVHAHWIPVQIPWKICCLATTARAVEGLKIPKTKHLQENWETELLDVFQLVSIIILLDKRLLLFDTNDVQDVRAVWLLDYNHESVSSLARIAQIKSKWRLIRMSRGISTTFITALSLTQSGQLQQTK